MSTIAVDFDGVIHAYTRGWADGTIYDEPVPGAFDAIRALMGLGHSVVVFTSRDPEPVATWITARSAIPTILDGLAGTPKFWDDTTRLLVTSRKLPAVAYIDDRAIHFRNWDQALADLAQPHILGSIADIIDQALATGSDRPEGYGRG